jgi:hypothetical protein
VTALVVNDFLGGDLMFADVVYSDGSAQGHHYWNRLGDGTEVDLTLHQFREGERVLPGRVVVRPPGPPRRCADEYQRLRDRVVLLLARMAREAGADEYDPTVALDETRHRPAVS